MTPLRQRMTEDMEIRNLSPNTQLSYLQQVSGFAKYCHRSPELVGPEEIRAYQLYLTNERKLAPGSLCIIASALRFLYRVTLKRDWVDTEIPLPKKPVKLPVILSRDEVFHFLESIGSCKHRAILMTPGRDVQPLVEFRRIKKNAVVNGHGGLFNKREGIRRVPYLGRFQQRVGPEIRFEIFAMHVVAQREAAQPEHGGAKDRTPVHRATV